MLFFFSLGALQSKMASPPQPQRGPVSAPVTRLAEPLKRFHKEAWHTPHGRLIREVIFGLNDGVISTIGFLAGVTASMGDVRAIALGGLASAFPAPLDAYRGGLTRRRDAARHRRRQDVAHQGEPADGEPRARRARGARLRRRSRRRPPGRRGPVGRRPETTSRVDQAATPIRGHHAASGHTLQRGRRATQIWRPWWIRRWANRVHSFGGSNACRSSSILSGSSLVVRPRRPESRRTWVSTKIAGLSKAVPSTTFAVFRPTPGSARSSSIVCGTRPSWCSTSDRATPWSAFVF